MKKLGLIGGTGPESTLIYYKVINQEVNKLTNATSFPEMTIESVNLYRLLSLMSERKYDELEDYLWDKTENLINSGCQIVALSCVTGHIIYNRLRDRLKAVSNVPFVSMPEAVCAKAQTNGYRRALLLGTIFTMKEDFFRKELENKGIDVVTPDEETMKTVHTIIANELELGIVKPESQRKLLGIIDAEKAEKQIDTVILGCTELPLALDDGNTPVPCLDAMAIHIQRLVAMCME
ncbi:MAG: amino acid racemase [Bacteroidales bacterium]|nr:amino acid racemase [Bacteroidales bacterium]